MPAILSLIATVLINIVGSVLGRVLLGLGLGFVEYVGYKVLVDNVVTLMKNNISVFQSGATAEMLAWAGVLQLDVCIGIVISAITVKFVIRGISGASFKRLVRS